MNEPKTSFASEFIAEEYKQELSRPKTYIGSNRLGWALRTSLVPDTLSAQVAAKMENDYRCKANTLADKNQVDKAQDVIRLGREYVEIYLIEQHIGKRIVASVLDEWDLHELETAGDAIGKGIFPDTNLSRSPIPSIVLSTDAAKML